MGVFSIFYCNSCKLFHETRLNCYCNFFIIMLTCIILLITFFYVFITCWKHYQASGCVFHQIYKKAKTQFILKMIIYSFVSLCSVFAWAALTFRMFRKHKYMKQLTSLYPVFTRLHYIWQKKGKAQHFSLWEFRVTWYANESLQECKWTPRSNVKLNENCVYWSMGILSDLWKWRRICLTKQIT